jgi:hypothetical protein
MPEKPNVRFGYYLALGASIVIILGFFGIREIRDLLPAKSEVQATTAPAGALQHDPEAVIEHHLSTATQPPQEPDASQRRADVAGEWRGYATSGSQRFPYHWIISQDGSDLTGSIELSLAPGLYHASYSFVGRVSSDTRLSFRGLRFNEYVPPPGGAWCLASGELYLSRSTEGRDIILHGTWTKNDVPGGCPAGTGGKIWLVRQ